MSEIIPVLELGKAKAKEAFLAGSGRVINPSRYANTRQVRYRMGRHRGKTPDQVDSEFERLWGSVSPAIRAKYAKMAGPQTSSGYGAKVEKPVARPVAAPRVPAADPVAIGTPEERARVAAMMQDGEGFATAGLGNDVAIQAMLLLRQQSKKAIQAAVATAGLGNDVAIQAAVAAAKQSKKKTADEQSAARAAEIEAARTQPRAGSAEPPSTVGGKSPAPVIEKPGAFAGATPTGMELVGMKSGVPQYAPVGEVYGQSPRAADSSPAGGVGPVRPEVTTDQIRADYQDRMQKTVPRPYDQYGPTRQPPVPRGPASQPAPTYQSPTEKGGAFSRDAYARTAAAQQTGFEQKAIREGKASEETRAKHADYVAKMEADRKMFPAAKPVSTFPASKPRFAMAR